MVVRLGWHVPLVDLGKLGGAKTKRKGQGKNSSICVYSPIIQFEWYTI